ncbi:MAG: hypothetical protein ACH350_03065 [Parachlamydiaceae bacterium]
MRKFVVTLMASLLSCSAAFAFWPEATDSSLEVGVGYRQDKLEWKTSSDFDSSSYGADYGKGLPVNLQSKLKWKDLQIWQIEAKGKYVTCDNIYLRANADYGWITSGKNTDSDYVTLDRSDDYFFGSNSGSGLEFAKSKSKAKGHVYDVKLALGYQFKMCDDSFAIAPLIGYSWNGQHIKDSHLKQNVYLDGIGLPDVQFVRSRSSYGSFSEYCDSYSSSNSGGKHSKYNAHWRGPFLGFDFDYRFGCGCEADWELFGTYEFHWARYHANGHWHLRPDLIDGFKHKAKNAYGQVFDIGIKWDFCECWTLALKGEFQWWWADKGHDRAKIAKAHLGNVDTDCFLTIPLRDIKWQSAAVSVDLGMVF